MKLSPNTVTPLHHQSVLLFVVIGTQRTGTNILREILNSNQQIAMLGEVLARSPAPAHWDNFCRNLPPTSVPGNTYSETESLLDQYFAFVRYRIRKHWAGNKKRHSNVVGVDIKYNQLGLIAPTNWDRSSLPFILCYLRSRGATIIHTTRNIVHCAISDLIAKQRHLWHNYEGLVIDGSRYIDVEQCLERAKVILRERAAFLNAAVGCKLISCRYEDLVEDIARAGVNEKISEAPGALLAIAKALRVRFEFRYDGRLRRAINIPYSRLLSNYDALVSRLKDSEFSALVSALE